MSALNPTTPLRGTQRNSRLRPLSNGSSDATHSTRPVTAETESDTGTVQRDPTPAKSPIERRCILWIHDDGFSKEEVVLNLDLLQDVLPGELLAIVPLKTDIGLRDFQDTTPKRDAESLSTTMQRERSGSTPQSPIPSNGTSTKHDSDLGNRYLFIAKDMPKEMKAKQPTLEVSVTKHIADVFGLKARSTVLITSVDPSLSSASHVELSFKDEYLARSDMWRLAVGELANKSVFKGQKILFMGTIKAQVASVYVDGRKVQSAFFSATTKPIFRSGSARYILFIQMSREMWDFDSEGSGEIMFNKVINGFLPSLFKKWASLQAKHLVSIVLFTRVEYDTGIASELATVTHDSSYHTGVQTDGNKRPYKDFYRVVVSEMASGSWTTILYQLKREFKFFRRDISLHRIVTANASTPISPDGNMRGIPGTRIEAEPSLAMHGNVLEAINLASTQFAHDYIDRDLMRTGISIVVITPCPGIFEVDYETLRMTTEGLIGNGIGIDLVCLPKMPLHSVPIFRYRNPQFTAFEEAQHLRPFRSEDSTPRQNAALFGSSFSSLSESLSPSKASQPERTHRSGFAAPVHPPTEWLYAIPHWLDVSFWTGASQDMTMADLTSTAKNRSSQKLCKRQKSEFTVRCKMYEMEMASVMENVMTEIAVTPLQHDSLFPSMILGPREIPGKRSLRVPTPNAIKREKPYASLTEFINGPSKPPYDRHSSLEEKTFFQALDTFDTNGAELLDDYPNHRYSEESRKYFKPGSAEAAKRLLIDDPRIFGTSFKDEHSTLKNASFLSGGSSGTSKSKRPSGDSSSKQRKDSVVSSMTIAPRTPSTKPPKFGHQISLGKFGFGIAAPKAATAEIQTEHVSAARPSIAANDPTTPTPTVGKGKLSNHFLNSATSQNYDRPGSSQSHRSQKPKTKSDSDNASNREADDKEKSSTIKPIPIKSALQSDSSNQLKSRSVLGSVYETAGRHDDGDSSHLLPTMRGVDDAQRVYNSKLLAGSVPELPTTLSPTTALAPWLSVLNPSNPLANDEIGPSQYRRWQHVFPKPTHTNTMKWKSLCSPASVPLTTEYFPTNYQLDTEYQQKPYNISQNAEDELSEVPKSKDEFLRELIGLRLSQGFQIVVGPAVAEAFGQKSLKIANVFDYDGVTEDGASVFMSMGNIIHQLSCVNETEIEVNMFVRKPTASPTGGPVPGPTVYRPAIRTTLSSTYESRQIILGKPREEYNWNYVDTFVAGFDEDWSENLRFWRARFVLIPVERPLQAQKHSGEDNEEEVRLEGIKKLTQTWQRHRVITPSERRFQSATSKKMKDPNPLDIVYKTEDPSVVVTAELETLPLVETGEGGPRRGQLFEVERFRKAKLDISTLAEAIQSPIEKGGVRMQNRRWHFRLHYNCFIGSDMTTWLIENFEDIETREEAVEFGNMLMTKDEMPKLKENSALKENGREKADIGLFVHVEKRHPFRDGQYFYQVTGEFAKVRPESRTGWFTTRRRDNSVPSTPMSESMMRESPATRPERSRSSSNHDEKSSDSVTTTPTTASGPQGGKRPKVALSKVMKYDVDHRKRSYRPERINLHYDRLHNPDNCYHIRIDWLGVTAKLIEDAIESWATTAERYGLKLVEAPIGEASSITSIHPFRSPYIINLALQPPTQLPRTYFDINSFGPQPVPTTPSSRHYYQKAIMRKFNFVLDIEAARNFPTNVDVSYSWGKPDYKYTQYIHRSGVLLAQILDDGGFMLLANRLFNNRITVGGGGGGGRDFSERYVKNDLNSSRAGGIGGGPLHSSHNFPPINRETGSPFTSPSLRPILLNQLPFSGGQNNSGSASGATFSSPTIRATSDVLIPQSTKTPLSLNNMSLSQSLNQSLSTLNSEKSNMVLTPEIIKNELEAFCGSKVQLEAFYKEILERPSVRDTPPVLRGVFVGGGEREIPTLGLPPPVGRGGVGEFLSRGVGGVVGEREQSPAPTRFGAMSGVMGGMYMGRRASVQVGALGLDRLGISGGAGVLGTSVGGAGVGVGVGVSGTGVGTGGGLSGLGAGGREREKEKDSPRGSVGEGDRKL